ncbi:MAG: endonuclease/exonuclease/phosphatase family protein [Geodermatophilaceae bacterium]|nr:endonuclease/exonuclease/phosphatase family protein [Geodermatophilaceae bacterium]
MRGTAGIVAAVGIVVSSVTPAQAADPGSVRFATFNASLNRFDAGLLITDLSTPGNAQAANVAEIIQRTAPDVVLINEFDFDEAGTALRLFQDNYLSVPQHGAPAIDYAYSYTAPVNTGVPSGFDLNNDGTVGGPDDAFGFGFFPGQFGMAVYSKYPIDLDAVRTFQTFLWKDMPGALLPDDPNTAEPADFYSPDELDVFRLSSKSHWDLPLEVGRRTVHFLVSHPTPPVFDGVEDRNGRRNSDEIRLWADYITPAASGYIYDDEGVYGGLPRGAHFVVAGDQNSDPLDGDSLPGSIDQLLDDPRVNTNRTPDSFGAVQAAIQQGGANRTHLSPPRFDTADFSEPEPGNLRVDYVLPSTTLSIQSTGVYWPTSLNPQYRLVYDPSFAFGVASSDHRLVRVDVRVPGA